MEDCWRCFNMFWRVINIIQIIKSKICKVLENVSIMRWKKKVPKRKFKIEYYDILFGCDIGRGIAILNKNSLVNPTLLFYHSHPSPAISLHFNISTHAITVTPFLVSTTLVTATTIMANPKFPIYSLAFKVTLSIGFLSIWWTLSFKER